MAPTHLLRRTRLHPAASSAGARRGRHHPPSVRTYIQRVSIRGYRSTWTGPERAGAAGPAAGASGLLSPIREGLFEGSGVLDPIKRIVEDRRLFVMASHAMWMSTLDE